MGVLLSFGRSAPRLRREVLGDPVTANSKADTAQTCRLSLEYSAVAMQEYRCGTFLCRLFQKSLSHLVPVTTTTAGPNKRLLQAMQAIVCGISNTALRVFLGSRTVNILLKYTFQRSFVVGSRPSWPVVMHNQPAQSRGCETFVNEL